jgi:O-antigen/teichoic acid export membrane protein
LGFLSTLVLVRLLSPSDFGLVAMAMLVFGLVESVMDLGVETAVIRTPNVTRPDVDTAWTIRLIQTASIAVIVALLAPLAGEFFREPRLVPVIWAVSLALLIASPWNIGMALARRELDFGREAVYGVGAKLISFVVTLAAAFWLRDYRALVLGVMTGHLSGLVLSYLLHPYRPRWCLASAGKLWSFSVGILASGIANFVNRKADEILVGRLGNPHQLGIYSVASELGQLVTAEIGQPINRALLPVLSSIQEDLPRARSALMATLSGVLTLTVPAGVGLAAVAPAVAVLLGEQWREAAPLLALFALFGVLRTTVAPLGTVLLVLGRTRHLAVLSWAEVVLFVGMAVPLGSQYGVTGIAWSRMLAVMPMVPVFFLVTRSLLGMRLREIGIALWRPVAGAGLMYAVLQFSGQFLSTAPLAELLSKVGLGVTAYASWMVLTWHLSGHPDGLERMVLERIGLRV